MCIYISMTVWSQIKDSCTPEYDYDQQKWS